MKVINSIKKHLYVVYFTLALVILDISLKSTYKSIIPENLISVGFTSIWIMFFIIILIISNKRLKKIFILTITILFNMLYLTNIIYINIFYKFFEFKDILLVGDGLDFFYTIFNYVGINNYLIIIESLLLMIIALIKVKYTSKIKPQVKITIIISILFIMISIYTINIYSLTKNPYQQQIYNEFNDSRESLVLTGLYEYSIRNLSLTLSKSSEIPEINLNEYFKEAKKSSYHGIYRDKNLILVQMETIDNFMINEDATPNIYQMMNDGINFTNRYAPLYTTGYTFQTEFVVNTGLLPFTSTNNPICNYTNFNYPNTLANFFKEKGYDVNSYHANQGIFYNRNKMHQAFGYNTHYDKDNLHMTSMLDSTLLKGNEDLIIKNSKFFSFVITYSAHMPFNKHNSYCGLNYQEIKDKYPNATEEYICALSQAKDTDNFFKDLIQTLKNKNLLENTVIIAYTDHFAYGMKEVASLKQTSDINLLSKVPLFIYNINGLQISNNNLTSSIDIMPIILDLFGIDNTNTIGKNTLYQTDNVIIFDQNHWLNNQYYYQYGFNIKDNEEMKITNQNVKETIKLSNYLIEKNVK